MKHAVNHDEYRAAIEQWMEHAVDEAVDFAFGVLLLILLLSGKLLAQ